MHPDQNPGGQGFHVQHDSLDAAARALPDQVRAVETARRVFTARRLPAGSFGEVNPASAQASEGHASTVEETDQGLATASGRMEKIIGEIRGTTTAVRDLDAKQAQEQRNLVLAQDQGQPLPRPTITLPNREPFEVQPGDHHVVPTDAIVDTGGGNTMGPDSGPGTLRMPDGTRIDKVLPEDLRMY